MTKNLIFLSLINWLHLLATAAWIGGFFKVIFILIPTVQEKLGPAYQEDFIDSYMKRDRILTYIAIVTLGVTGMLMTTFNRHYLGLMQFGNLWCLVSLIKHIVIVVLLILTVCAFEIVAPKVTKLAAKEWVEGSEGSSPELESLKTKQIMLSVSGFLSGIAVLFLTGIITAISATAH